MLPVDWLIFAVCLAVLLTAWVTFTATRLDRLHARVDAAWAALDAQLVRRCAALQHACELPRTELADSERSRYDEVAARALAETDLDARAGVENAVGRAVAELVQREATLTPDSQAELTDAANRVMIARRFYNDAVRDTQLLRKRRLARVLHLAGHRAMPVFFDIDDVIATPSRPLPEAGNGTVEQATEA